MIKSKNLLLLKRCSEDKKVIGAKKCVIIRKFKFENYKNCLETTQLENKISYLEKNKIHIDSFKEFIKNDKPISKTHQGIKVKIKVFAEEGNKIALTSNDDKKMQSIDLIETYVYGTSEDLVSDKKEIKCNNTIK